MLSDIFKKREASGTFLDLFCSNYARYCTLIWLLVRKSLCVTGLSGAAVLLLPSAMAANQVGNVIVDSGFLCFGLYPANLFAVIIPCRV